jgi:mannose-6-phosphate isomerase-like protein (cupin superfamily)
VKIAKDSVVPFDFEGLQIADYTSEINGSSSLAEITVPPGGSHPRAYSKRSDKYYYVVSGYVEFAVKDKVSELITGDVCVIPKGQWFSYQNSSKETAKLVLVHTPSFDLESEVLEK